MEKILQNVLKTLPLSRIHRFTDLLTNGVSSLEEQRHNSLLRIGTEFRTLL